MEQKKTSACGGALLRNYNTFINIPTTTLHILGEMVEIRWGENCVFCVTMYAVSMPPLFVRPTMQVGLEENTQEMLYPAWPAINPRVSWLYQPNC
jgi:hypothetical protein